MSRRQSLDRPGILSPPGPFLTPSPSPSISASPRLQPSPSLSPFPQDVLLVTGNPLTNSSTHEQERKTVTPGRRQSIHQFTNGSPSAGTVVFQPSPSQSPAAATSVIGVTAGGGLNVVAGFPSSVSQNTITTSLPTITTTTGNELNTTLVGSNNIQLNKKGTKRQQQQQQQHHQIFSSSSHYSHLPSLSTTTTIAGGYGQLHATTINNTPNTFATTTVASTPKNQTKKGAANSATVLPISQQNQSTNQQQQQQSQQQFHQYQTSSPLIADSPSPSPSGTAITSASIKSPTPQPAMQMLQQQFTIASNSNSGNGGPQQQTFQLIQGPQGQIIAAATSQNLQQQQLNRFNPTPTTNIVTSTAAATLGTKSVKAPQQILPKPQQLQQQQLLQQQQQQQLVDQFTQQQKSKTPNPTPSPAPVTSSSNMSQPSLTQISQTAQPGQQQIILPSGATASLTTTAQQPLLLNQVPVLVQQNTPQGVQLILRPPTPQLTATPSLVIQNRAQPQLQQHQQPQQVLRILGTNGATMQLAAATPTFIVSSQANLIQQANHLQTIKTQSQSPAITQLSGLHAALSAAAAANSQQQRSQQFATTAATINGHLLSPSVAAQIQNLQLAAAAAANGNGLTAQIQMPNGLTTSGATTLLSQLPGTAQFQQNSQGFNINLNQLSGANIQQIAAAAAAGATFQTPPPLQTQNNAANNGQPQNQQNSGNNNTTANTTTATNDLFSNSSNTMSNLTQSSPAHCPVAVTPEPLRQPTPVLQNIPAASPQLQQTHNPPAQIQLSLNAAATIQLQQHQQQQQQAQIQQLQQQIQQTQNQVQQAQQQANQIQQQQTQQIQNLPPQPAVQTVQQETKKKPKPRKKKTPAANTSSSASTANNNKSLTTTANKSLNTNTSTTSVLAPTITSTSNTIKMVPNIAGQEQIAGQQQITTNITTNAPPTNQNNQNFPDTTTMAVQKSPSPPPQIQRASNGKLDLGNVMKLCGITDEDDEDFMDTTPTEDPTANQAINSTQNFTISIPQPNGTSETLPYTLSIPGIQATPATTENTESQEPAANIVIKIDPTDGVGSTNSTMAQPYSITIPRLPTQEEIQKQSQQHLSSQQQIENNSLQLKQQQNLLASQPLNTNITFSMPINSVASSMPSNSISQLISNSLAPSNSIANNAVAAVSTPVVATTTTTTATVKPRRKPAAKRNNKKDTNNTSTSVNSAAAANSNNLTQTVSATSTVVTPAVNITTSAISTPLSTPALVPSQIGNIQISQIENRLGNNQNHMIPAPMTSLVENKIQIMPIMDNKNTNSAQLPQLQQTQIVFQPNNTANNITIATAPATQSHQALQQEQNRPMQFVALPQFSNSSQTSNVSTSTLNQQSQQPQSLPTGQISVPLQNPPTTTSNPTLMPPITQNTMLPGLTGNVSISVGTPNTIAGIIPQLTGSLILAVSEQCERLILRHDPNQPQDQQSQLILQALLKGALPNVTIINEPTKVEPPKSIPTTASVTTIQQPTLPQLMLTPTSVPSTPTTSAASSVNNSSGAISKANKKTNKQATEAGKQPITQNVTSQLQKAADGNSNSSSIGNLNSNLNTNMNLGINPQIPPNVTMPQQRYIALPKIDPNTQQLFSLNPLNNQITPLNPNQTTASIGPSERLLIAPAGINAQQLAQCLQQGQLHFNDVNPITTQQTPVPQQQQIQQTNNLQMTQQQPMNSMGCNNNSNQQPKQQIVYPMTSQMNLQGMITTTTTTTTTTSNTTTVCSSTQPATTTTTTTTTKQVANVAPIIDQSKAKQDVKQINNSGSGVSTGAVPKKKPVRKPKASTTTAADVALMKNASVVKPMPKLDPLSQKPNNNPVQIVQPNTASGKPVVSTSNTSTTTTTTSNVVTIQPFQTQTSTGTKLVGVTAPMQQQPQNNLQQSQQRPQINYTPNFSTGITTTNTTSNLNTNPSINNGIPLSNITTNTTMSSGVNNPPANQTQQTVSRPIQTIQLTSQLQQMLKQVQMQIQYLTVKLQHKNLLSSMPLPADLDPNIVAAFNKPMSDIEINTALQRLFMEQQRIIDAGKEVPTPEPFIRNAGNATGNFVLMQTNNFTPDNSKLNTANIPANIVQPNNHSTLSGNINAGNATNTTIGNIQQQPTQKIHIYPIQHQQQTQQQNKQTKQTKQQQVVLNNSNTLNQNNTNSNVSVTTPTSVATVSGNSGSKITNKQKSNQNQQQPQLTLQQTQNNNNSNTLTTTTIVNPPTLKPQLPQLSSLTTTPSLPTLPYPSLPHVINITNMPAVLQQKHFTQHLQMQQQQLIQQQQQQQQKLQNSNTKSSNNFTTFNVNLASIPGFQQGPPPLIFPTSTTTSTNNNTTVSIAAPTTSATLTAPIPQLSALSQQHQPLAQLQQPTQIQFQASNIATAPTFAVSIGNQKAYVPIITGAIATVTSSAIQQTSLASPAASMNTVVSALPQVITATAATSTLTTTAATATTVPSSGLVPTSVPTITTATGSLKPLLTFTPTSTSANAATLNNSIVVQNAIFNGGINVNIVGNPIAQNQNQTVVKTEEHISPKAKLARLSLFLRQLEVDQQSCLNSDYKSPFQNKEEAVKRLIRYHCMYQPDEDIPSEEEEEFEKTALRFQDKFRELSSKFQQILLQESMLEHRTSEIVQIKQLMVDDLRQEIEDSKQLEKDILEYELLQQQQPQQLPEPQQQDEKDDIKKVENPNETNVTNNIPSPLTTTAGIFDQIKNEVKSEPLDVKPNLEENSNNDSNSNFCNNLHSSSASLDSIKNEIKGEPCENSLTSSSGVKSSCSSMDSFDLLKQSPIVNSSFKKQTVTDAKEPKKEELANQWKQSYMDSKASNNYYSHLANASVNMSKPSNHVFNGAVKKPQSQQQTAASTATPPTTATVNVEIKKDEKDNFENFDIESEITPSFIMKKQEPKESVTTPVTSASVTTTTSANVQSTSTTNAHTSASKHQNTKSTKQPKVGHTFENNTHVTNNTNAVISNSFQQNQHAASNTASQEVITTNFDFSQHLPVNTVATKQQEDDWLCLQKELNLMNSVNPQVSSKNIENSTNNSTTQASAEPLGKTLDFLSNTTTSDLFPNGCINKNMETQLQNQTPTNMANTSCNAAAPLIASSSCSQQNQQPSLSLAGHEENQQATDLNEFFSGSEDSEVHKDVETRLEAMFGESPVHLAGNKERSGSPDDIESGLESIFGESNKSPSNNHCSAKEKSNWETDFTTNAFITATNQQHSTNYMNSTNNMPHHIQLGSANNPRWMQNMEAQFPDFLSGGSSNNNSAVNDCLSSRKRQWNGHIVDENSEHVQQQTQQQQQLNNLTQDEESPQKKMCDGSLNTGGLNDSSTSNTSLGMQQQQQPQTHHHHNLVPNDTTHAQELMDAALLSLHDGLGVDNTATENPNQTNGFSHMMNHQNFNSYGMESNQQQQQQQHFMNIAQQQNMTVQQQQMLNNHMMQMNHHQQQQQSNMHGNHHAGTGEFDDDITRHVQNAIDSILNLQSSEADSLSFSLDHSMGSFLGDTILNDNQSGATNNGVSCQDPTKRRHLVDELSDCLMGNSSTDTPLLMDTTGSTTGHAQLINHSGLHHNNIQQQHHDHVNSAGNSGSNSAMNHHHAGATGGNNIAQQQQQLNDFNCVVGGIDDAVKSIMS